MLKCASRLRDARFFCLWLFGHRYASPAAFAADVELTFQNALRYGGEIAYEDPDTEVQCLVPALAKVALETWKTLVPSV